MTLVIFQILDPNDDDFDDDIEEEERSYYKTVFKGKQCSCLYKYIIH